MSITDNKKMHRTVCKKYIQSYVLLENLINNFLYSIQNSSVNVRKSEVAML